VDMDNVVKRPLNPDGTVRKMKRDEANVKAGMTLKTIDDFVSGVEAASGESEKEVPEESEGSQKEEKCGSCYGAHGPDPKYRRMKTRGCCNSCDDVRRAYKVEGWKWDSATKSEIPACHDQVLRDTIWDNDIEPHKAKEAEGCNIAGFVDVPRTAGSFHFSPSTVLQNLHGRFSIQKLLEMMHESFDLTHRIQKISFGAPFPGATEPLNGLERQNENKESGMFQYYVKIVRTEYVDGSEPGASEEDGKVLASHQYSVTEHFRKLDFGATATGAGLPGVYFFYDFSSVMMRIERRPRSLSHFLTLVCAIIGGVFTVMGLFDGAIEKILEQAIRPRASNGIFK